MFQKIGSFPINPNTNYKILQNYLQNTQHEVLRKSPFPIYRHGKACLACLNNPHGVQLGTLA